MGSTMNIGAIDPMPPARLRDRLSPERTTGADGRVRPQGAEEGIVEAKAAKSPESAKEIETPPAPAPIVLPEFRHTELSFRIEETLNRVVIQVIDAKSGDVLRSIPPEDLISMARNLRNVRGLLLDEEG